MNTSYHEEAIAQMKSGICLSEISLVQRTLDSRSVTDKENLYIFWQIYLKMRRRFIVCMTLIPEAVFLLIYLFYCTYVDTTSSKGWVNEPICFIPLWLFAGLVIWVFSGWLFVRLRGGRKIDFPQKQLEKEKETGKTISAAEKFHKKWGAERKFSGTVIRILKAYNLTGNED